ncbi:TPA: GTP-binding protein [Candidatus Poribacteria bacterium]|nr:GTP-binding protein [Candidatus Poribacteria bacterium]
MPMPHRVMEQKIKKRLKGKEGKARIDELKKILNDLPNYRSGPYGQIRKWVNGEIEKTRSRSKIQHHRDFAVKKEGDFQIVLVGAPNSGKSSLLKALSNIQIRVADYAFTTLRPIPALFDCGGITIQLVEIPGIIKGAAEDRGGGKALLGVAKSADAIILLHDLTMPPDELDTILSELQKANIEPPSLLVCTKFDCPGARESFADIQKRFPQFTILAISAEKRINIEQLENALRELTGLIRIYPKSPLHKDAEDRPIVLPIGSTVEDLARSIHKDLATQVKSAKIEGSSAKFPRQKVGQRHVLEDKDIVTLLS